MGGRKFRLAVHRKNEERKRRHKKAIVVENKVEDAKTSDTTILTTCPISLPLTAFMSGHVQSLAQLSSRVKAVVSKYDTWAVTCADPLVICKIQVQNKEGTMVAVIATISISSDFHWTLSWNAKEVVIKDCPLFKDLPDKIQSIDDVDNILALIESAEVCVGNPDEKFLDLWHYRSTTLNHLSGKCMYTTACKLNILLQAHALAILTLLCNHPLQCGVTIANCFLL